MHPRVRITGGKAGGGWGRGRQQSPDCQTRRKRTQDQADSEQMDVADKAPGTVQVGGGIGELVKISWLGVDCKHGVPELKTSE